MCISPQSFKFPDGKLITVPCNRCFECVRARKLKWTIRILSECYSSDVSYFSLLSYNDENLPDPMIHSVSEIQKLIKRLRINLNRLFVVPKDFQNALGCTEIDLIGLRKDITKPITFKYFIVSEYGEKKNRLHYHCVFMFNNVNSAYFNRLFWKVYLEHFWGKGFASAFPMDPNRAKYCCKYIQKSYNMMLYSKGLGKDKYLSSAIQYKDGLPYFAINGKTFTVPKSWCVEILGQQMYSILASSLAQKPSTSITPLKDKLLINEKYFTDNPDKIPCPREPKYDPSLGLSVSDDF